MKVRKLKKLLKYTRKHSPLVIYLHVADGYTVDFFPWVSILKYTKKAIYIPFGFARSSIVKYQDVRGVSFHD